MEQSIRIKVLGYDDFDRLPSTVTRGADVSQSIGFADTEKRSIYVRDTGVDQLNKYLIDHELEHLFEAEGTDVDSEHPMIRHKLFGGVLPAITGAAGKVGGGLVSGAQTVGGGLVKGAQAVGGGLKDIGTGAIGAAQKAGGFVKGAGQSLLSSFAPSATAGAIPSAATKAVSTGASISPFLGPPQQALAQATNPLAKFASSVASPIAQGAGKTSDTGSSILSKFGDPAKLLGTGLLATGLMKGLPKAPPLPPSVPALQQQIQSGGSELGQLGRQALTTQLGQQFDPMSEPEIQASLHQLEIEEAKAMDQVRDLYRNLRPGSDPSSDSAFGRDIQEVQDQFARAKSDTVANRTRELKANFDAQRTQQIQQAIGASDSEMQQLSQIAQLDVEQIAQQLQLDYEQATLFKNTFIDIGSTLISPEASILNKLFPQLA